MFKSKGTWLLLNLHAMHGITKKIFCSCLSPHTNECQPLMSIEEALATTAAAVTVLPTVALAVMTLATTAPVVLVPTEILIEF